MPGTGEILVILVLVLLLFGPDKLPDLARQLGRGVRELNRMKGSLTDQFNLHGDDDDAPRRSTYKSSTQSSSFSSETALDDDREDDVASWRTKTTSEISHSPAALDPSERDEDDLAADLIEPENDWRHNEEKPLISEPHVENVEEAKPLNRLDAGERPAPPGVVARSSWLSNTDNDNTTA